MKTRRVKSSQLKGASLNNASVHIVPKTVCGWKWFNSKTSYKRIITRCNSINTFSNFPISCQPPQPSHLLTKRCSRILCFVKQWDMTERLSVIVEWSNSLGKEEALEIFLFLLLNVSMLSIWSIKRDNEAPKIKVNDTEIVLVSSVMKWRPFTFCTHFFRTVRGSSVSLSPPINEREVFKDLRL